MKTPLYTISGRHKEPIDERLKVPAPGAYDPEKGYKFILTYSPQHTFGIKVHTTKYVDTPAPNKYVIPSVLDTPVYTMSGRHHVPVDERVKVPAPGTYSPEKVHINRKPQITFGIKHSPLLGQLKPVDSIKPKETTTNTPETSNKISQVTKGRVTTPNDEEMISMTRISNYDDDNRSDISHSRTHVTQIRQESDVRSTTVTPEPVKESLTQEIVWIPEKPARRGSYTIETSDGTGFNDHYENTEVIPVENGMIRKTERGERGAMCTEEQTSEVIKRNNYEQNVDKNIKNATAHERNQKATEQVHTDTEVQHLPNGGIAKTTTTTTVKRVGTADRTANARTTVTRTATAVTSRDVGVK